MWTAGSRFSKNKTKEKDLCQRCKLQHVNYKIHATCSIHGNFIRKDNNYNNYFYILFDNKLSLNK